MNNKKGLGIAGVVTALVALVGGGLYLHNKKSKDVTEQQPEAEYVEDNESNEEK